MCLGLHILLAISFLDYPQIESWYDVNYNSLTVCSGQLISQRYCFVRFEISGNLSFCLLRSLTSFDGKVTTRIVSDLVQKKYEILRHLRITKPIFILLVIFDRSHHVNCRFHGDCVYMTRTFSYLIFRPYIFAKFAACDIALKIYLFTSFLTTSWKATHIF